MKSSKIMEYLEELYPSYLKASYDNVGLMVGRKEKEVKTIYLCLDLTKEEMDEALKCHADMIITHHPLLFHPLYNINLDNDPGLIIESLIKNDITLYSMHTNFDTVRMNDYLGSMLGLSNMSLLSEKENCGVVGDIKETKLLDFIKLVKKVYKINELSYVGSDNITIKKVGLCAGSGSSMITDAFSKSVDIYLTGDLSYSRAIEAKRMGLNILNIPHYTEHLYTGTVKEDLLKLDKGLNVIESVIDSDPFKIY